MSEPRSLPPATLLARFRSHKKRLPLHPLERAVLTVVALHLCFLPWALGTMHAWSQITSLCISAVGFLFALCPRTYSGDYALAVPAQALGSRVSAPGQPDSKLQTPNPRPQTRAAAYRVSAMPRLVRFPIFWIGLALLTYIAIQGFNPSWVWERNATHWWLRRVTDIPWLPTSVDTPFERFNVWRQFIIYASAWLTVCTVWIGFTRRRSLELLLVTILINAGLLAVVGFIDPILSPASFLGLRQWSPGATPFASFIYKNHAGAYFALATSLTLAMAVWVHHNGMRKGHKSTPAGILIFVAFLLVAGVLASESRGATITVSAFLLAVSSWMLLRNLIVPSPTSGNRTVSTLMVLVFSLALVGAVKYLDFSVMSNRLGAITKDPNHAIGERLLAYDAGQTMLADHWERGTGAGSFRHLFTEYIKKHPSIYAGGRLFWDHAHRDWLEIPIELGVVGSLLLLIGGAYAVIVCFRRQVTWHPLAAPLLLGCSQTLAHAWFDFPFQCPAILVTWLTFVTVSARWLELDLAQSPA